MYGYIYKTTNLINGKIYVGLHRKSEFDRKYYGSGTILKQAISKYGVDNFTCEVIEWCETLEDLEGREIYWINELNCLDKEVGYNLHSGGGAPPIFTGENHPNWGGQFPSPFKGKHHTEEAKKKMSKAKKGKRTGSDSPHAKKIINITTNEIFDSIVEAANAYNIEHSINIVNACRGRYGTCGGYEWAYYSDYINNTIPIFENERDKEVINLDTGKIFKSQKEAGEFYNINTGHISCVCKGRRKTTGGYRWMYYEDYLELQNQEVS